MLDTHANRAKALDYIPQAGYMHEEGVIKFITEYTVSPALPLDDVRELNAWRHVLVLLRVLGQDPARYDGYGFGNISTRLGFVNGNPHQRPFLITGTQTGEIPDLTPEHFVVVTQCYPAQNRIVAEGPIRPSSESMTHGAIYTLDPDIRWVMHGHSPEIWHAATHLGIPTTRADVPYGTPEMSAEVARLWNEGDLARRGIFSMGGHEDGIVTFGATAHEAFQPLINALIASRL